MDLLPTVVSILDTVLDWQFLRGGGGSRPPGYTNVQPDPKHSLQKLLIYAVVLFIRCPWHTLLSNPITFRMTSLKFEHLSSLKISDADILVWVLE